MDGTPRPRPGARWHAVAAAVCALLALAAAACGSGDEAGTKGTPSAAASASPHAAASPTSRAVSTTPAPAPSTTPPALPPDSAVSSSDTPAPATPTVTVPPDRERVPAPIDSAEMVVRESAPPQYAVQLVSGLPNGCAQFAGITTLRTGAEITITVENSMPRDKAIACTQIYGTREATVELGSDFTAGATYTVHVNDRTLTFTAQ